MRHYERQALQSAPFLADTGGMLATSSAHRFLFLAVLASVAALALSVFVVFGV